MARNRPVSENPTRAETPLFVTWEEGDNRARGLAIANASQGFIGNEPVVRRFGESANATNVYRNAAPNNVSIRDGYTKEDYDWFRPDGRTAVTIRESIKRCMLAYERHGLVRNIIDMMADFTIQGITLNHPNEKIEKFYKAWFRKIHGVERSERFVNLFFRIGNVVVQRSTAKISGKQEDQMRAQGADVEINPGPPIVRREIPWRFTFMNPLVLQVVAEELAAIIGPEGYMYQIKLPSNVITSIKKKRKSESESSILRMMPDSVLDAVQNGTNAITLDKDKVRSFFYRKDDWHVWAVPMLNPILTDLDLLEKMKLADKSALDGAISCIRVWRLGNIEARIMPTAAGISRLAEMLMNNVGGGVMDLIWGPEIDLLETKTDVHQFLGATKYAPVLAQIFAGLGIPPTLVGSETDGGFTNNAISLKTLIERMNYARQALVEFWEEEIRIVQQAMGFRFPATIGFDRMTLMDEAQEQALLIQLLDRMGMSLETIQERFGMSPEIENVRIRRENRKRDAGQLPRKAGPFHGDNEMDLKKIMASTGIHTASELGVNLNERKPGEQSPAEVTNKLQSKLQSVKNKGKQAETTSKPKGRSGQGRPKNKKDSTQRKKRTPKARTSASDAFMQAFAWAEDAQASIASITSPAYLASIGKKTLRELSTEQARAFEAYKFNLLCNLDPDTPVNEDTVAIASQSPLSIPAFVSELMKVTVAKHVEKHGTQPTAEMMRRFQSGAVALWKGEFDGEDEVASEETGDIADGLSTVL